MGQAIINKEFIDSKISRHNLQKMRLLCKITTVILICIILFKSIQNSFFSNFNFVQQLDSLPLVIILITNGAFMYYSRFYYKKSNYVPIPIGRLTNIYVFSLLSAGVVITIWDPEMYNQMMMFSLIMIVASSYFIIEKKQLVISIFINSFALIIGLYFQQGYTEQFQKQVLYLMMLVPISIYISGAFYRSYSNMLQAQARLVEEIKANRKLASELCEANNQLSMQASLDPLTGLFNRRALNEYMTSIASRAMDEPLHLTVIMLDVDYFKYYNDLYGHIEGDKVLIQVAQVLQSVTKEHDVYAARYGGEEFTLVLVNANEDMIQAVCETIQLNVEQLQITHGGSNVASYVTVSLGAYSQQVNSGEMVQRTLEQADRVLYEVKNKGRNSYQAQFVEMGE